MQESPCNWQHEVPYNLHTLVFFGLCLGSFCVNELHHTQHIFGFWYNLVKCLGIYVFAGRPKCSVIIVDWLVCVVDVSGLGLDGDMFLAVKFWKLFFFSLFFCSIGFQMVGNLNDIPLMWCLLSSE